MQFLILLTGVLVFVFYHFDRPPLLWNPVELKRLEAQAPRQLQRVKAQFEGPPARQAAAEGYARERDGERPGARSCTCPRSETRRPRPRPTACSRDQPGKPFNDTNYIFPSYVVSQLPRGLAGLVIAVIFAAAMSTLSGELNSLATATMVDFYQRFVKTSASDPHYLAMSRLFTAFWGLFACVVALQAGQLGSAIEVVNRFGSFYGSILGVFVLAVLAPWASARGAFYGLFAGMATVFLVSVSRASPSSGTTSWALTVFAVGLLITSLAPNAPAPDRSALRHHLLRPAPHVRVVLGELVEVGGLRADRARGRARPCPAGRPPAGRGLAGRAGSPAPAPRPPTRSSLRERDPAEQLVLLAHLERDLLGRHLLGVGRALFALAVARSPLARATRASS